LSGWGGLLPFFRFFNATLAPVFEAVLPERTSNNQILATDVVRTLVATTLVGGTRFAHVDRIREDEVIRQITGAKKLGGADAVRRYFDGLTRSQSEAVYAGLQRATWALLGSAEVEDVLDLDSTILNRFGEQDGVSKGYHPTKRIARSHHPLLGMLANAKMIVHCWLRAGGASTHRGALEFVDELLATKPANVRIAAIRADSGFFSKEYLEGFEGRGLHYAISMKISRPVRRFCDSISKDLWQRFDDQNEVADTSYAPAQWRTTRRVVVVRSRVKGQNEEQSLFDLPIYDYRVIVTDLNLPAIDLVHFYNKRGDCENRIKEFKSDLGARGFCLGSFTATEVVLRILAATFNVLTSFKAHVLNDTTLTLGTIRNSVFVVGASLGRAARKVVLRLGLTGRWRKAFEELLARAATCANSTAAQFANPLQELNQQPPTAWRARRPKLAIL
jgi:hypothetical protein